MSYATDQARTRFEIAELTKTMIVILNRLDKMDRDAVAEGIKFEVLNGRVQSLEREVFMGYKV